jgi:hypothetical protein
VRSTSSTGPRLIPGASAFWSRGSGETQFDVCAERVTGEPGVAGPVPTVVYLLWHSHGPDPDDNAKLLGVYSSAEAAQRRLETAQALPGFERHPDGFVISEYEVDKDEWTSGFATMTPDGRWIDDPKPRDTP